MHRSPEAGQAPTDASLAAIVESSDDAIVSKTLNGIITSWNRAAERLFGYSAEEAIGCHITLIIPKDREHEETTIIDRIRVGERVEHFETVRQHKSGEHLDISVTVSPIKDETGAVIGASKIARDIRPAREAERDRAHLAAIVDSSDDAIVSKDLNGIIRSWNTSAGRIFGYSPEEAIGQHITLIIPPDLVDEETTIIGRIRNGERVDHFETLRQAKSGALINVSLTVSPIRDAQGSIIGASKVARDMTEQKRNEDQLRLATDAGGIGLWDVDLVQDKLFWDKRCKAMFGISPDVPVSMADFYNGLHPDDQGRTTEAFLAAQDQATGKGYDVEYRTVGKEDGIIRWIAARGHGIFDRNGKCLRVLGTTIDITMRKAVEENLAEQARQLEALTHSMPQLVWAARPDGRLDFVNRHTHDYVGDLEIQNETVQWQTVIHPDDLEPGTAAWTHSLQTGADFAIEQRLYHAPTRTYRWNLSRALPIRNDDGEITRWFGTSTDIEDQKRAAQQIADEKEAITALYEVGEGFSGRELHDAVQIATDIATGLTGAQFGAFFYNVESTDRESYMLYTISGVDRSHFDKFPMPRNTAIFAPTFAGERVVRLADVTVSPNYGMNAPHKGMPPGHLPVRSYLAVPVISKGGEVLGGLFFGHENVGVFSDRGERIARAIAAQAATGIESARSLHRAQESERQFKNLANSINQMVWVTRVDGYHEYYNQRWYEFTGLDERVSAGDGWMAVIHPDDIERSREAWHKALETAAPYEIEYRIRRADGDYRWALGRAEAARDKNGQITKWFGTCTDIQDLVDARQKAEAASIAKSEFLANMSHEIRTPMNAIIGLSHILAMSRPLTKRQEDYLKTLSISANSLLSLINDLLDIAKIENNSVELEQVSFSLPQLIEEVSSMMAVWVKEKGLTFTSSGECINDRDFIGDPTRIRQIILNLCSNAVKFTERGSIHVSIYCHKTDDPKVETVCIAVNDTGVGISPDKADQIFDKFVQADSSITRKYGGTGLGLAITKTLTDVMGGTISVESKPGVGSTFTVCLPMRLSARSREHSRSNHEAMRHTGPAQSTAPRVLLVEDHEPNILVAQTYLESFGFQCEVAYNGVEAFAKLKAGSFAAVLMDVQMPGMNGFEATQMIRAHERQKGLPHIPIIGMTAHAMAGDRERCLAAGMNEYIAKPFNPDELNGKLVVAFVTAKEN